MPNSRRVELRSLTVARGVCITYEKYFHFSLAYFELVASDLAAGNFALLSANSVDIEVELLRTTIAVF